AIRQTVIALRNLSCDRDGTSRNRSHNSWRYHSRQRYHPLRRILPVLLLAAFILQAKDKKAVNELSADTVNLSGKLYLDPEAVKQLVGNDLGGHYIVVQMTVTPKGDKPLNVQLSDFQLFSEGDGDRSQPSTPAEVAASDSLVLKRGQSGIGSLG